MRKIFLLIALFVSYTCSSQFVNFISRNNAGDTSYGTHYDTLQRGGYQVVANKTVRNAIPYALRKQGMWVKTAVDDSVFNWTGAAWEAVVFSSGASLNYFNKDSLIKIVPQFDYAKNIFGTEYLIALHNAIASGTAAEIFVGGTSQIEYHEPNGSPVDIVRDLATREGYNANITFYNGAVAGSNAQDFINTKLPEIQSRQPKCVVISHEINDASAGVATYRARMDTILRSLRSGGNGIITGKDVTQLTIVLMTSSATNDYLNGRDSAWYIQANLVLRDLARKYKAAFVDTWNAFNDANSTWMDAPYPSNPDIGIHPTPVANRWIGGMLYDCIFPQGLQTYAPSPSTLPTYFKLVNIGGADSIRSVTANPLTYAYGASMHRTTNAPYNGAFYTFRHKDDVAIQYNVGYENGYIAMRGGYASTWFDWVYLGSNKIGSDTVKSVSATPNSYNFGTTFYRSTDAPYDGELVTHKSVDNVSLQFNTSYLNNGLKVRNGHNSTWYDWIDLTPNLNFILRNLPSSDTIKSVAAGPNTYPLGASFYRTTDAPNDGSLFNFRQKDNVNLQFNVGYLDGKVAIRGGDATSWYNWYKLDSFLVNPLTTTGDIIVANGSTATRLPIGSNGTVLTSNGTTATWQTPASASATIVAQGVSQSITGITTDATLASYTTPNTGTVHSYRIGADIKINNLNGSSVKLRVSFTDVDGASVTQDFYPMGSSTSALTTGYSAMPSVTITAAENTAITVQLVFTATVGGVIHFGHGVIEDLGVVFAP